ncbi:MAG: hypothetical protein IAE80_10465 [Anaerolinea sp.]|nr:hypothetical protein [Anaerolinea sp.]
MIPPTTQESPTSDTIISLEQFYGELIRDYLQGQNIYDTEKLCSDLKIDIHQVNLGMRWYQAQQAESYTSEGPFLSSPRAAHLGEGVIRVGGGNWNLQHPSPKESASPTLLSPQASWRALFLVKRQTVLITFLMLFAMFLLGYLLSVNNLSVLEALLVGGLIAMLISIIAGTERRSARR